MGIQVKSPILEALKNPKLWGAVLTILSLFGVTLFKNVDGNTLIGAIVTIVTILGGATAYENGKKTEAKANVEAAQMHADAVARRIPQA